MNAYAFATKTSEDSYEVFNSLHLPEESELSQRIENALDSGLPITTMVTTDLPNLYPGAVWDGEAFVGGERPENFNDTLDWGRYSFLVDSVLFLTLSSPKGNHMDVMTEAAFDQEVIIIKIPEGQTVVRGSVWDGTSFTDPE
jgi:hypothetical protein